MNEAGGGRRLIQAKYRKIHPRELEWEGGQLSLDGSTPSFAHGAFGNVKKAKWNGEEVAVKVFRDADRRGGFLEELTHLSVLQGCQHIVVMHGAHVADQRHPQPFIVLELAPLTVKEVLHDQRGYYKYTADNVMNWAYQLAAGLVFIHGKGMVHRDIKPSNLLLFNHGCHLKLCDFGTTRKMQNTLTNFVGTIRYMAPEVIQGRHYSSKCDVFSFGITMWEMITRKEPAFKLGQDAEGMAVVFAVANGARPQMIRDIPQVISQMIARCWDQSPLVRPEIYDVKRKVDYLCGYIERNKPLVRRRKPKVPDLFEWDQDRRRSYEKQRSSHDTPSPKPRPRPRPATSVHVLHRQEVSPPDVPPDVPRARSPSYETKAKQVGHQHPLRLERRTTEQLDMLPSFNKANPHHPPRLESHSSIPPPVYIEEDDLYAAEPVSSDHGFVSLEADSTADTYDDREQQQRYQSLEQRVKSGVMEVEPGQVLEIAYSDLQFIKPIGRGSAGSVFQGVWKSKGLEVAIKRVLVYPSMREIQILNKLRHPNVITFYGAVTVVHEFSIVTELAEMGSLFLYLKEHPEPCLEQSMRWAKEVAQGIRYLHQNNIIHRDLKSGNVLLTSSLAAKICDFGSAKESYHDSTILSSKTGTVAWMSPEALRKDRISKAWDVYSYGVLLWELQTHQVPFSGIPEDVLRAKVIAGERPQIPPKKVIPRLAFVMQICWVGDPKRRPEFDYIISVLI